MSMRLATTSMMVSFFLTAMHLKGLLQCGAREMMRVPSLDGVAGVEDEDGDVASDSGQDGGGMEDLGAEVGEFGGFFEADDLDTEGVGTDARVGGHDAVDVGPDLDGFGAQGASDQGTSEIRAAAAEGGGDAGFIRADEAAQDGDEAGVEVGLDFEVAALFDEGVEGNGFLKLRVGEDDFAGVDVDGLEVAFQEGLGDHDAGQAFAVADDEIGDARGEFEDDGEAAEDFVEGVELVFDGGLEGAAVFGVFDQGGGGVAMAAAQAGADGEGAGAISAAGGGCAGE